MPLSLRLIVIDDQSTNYWLCGGSNSGQYAPDSDVLTTEPAITYDKAMRLARRSHDMNEEAQEIMINEVMNDIWVHCHVPQHA